MKKFKIYSGLSGGFGGAKFDFEDYFEDENEALEIAYRRAIEQYESYEGLYGLMSYEECEQEIIDTYGYAEEAEVDDYYNQEIENWIDYYVEEIKEEK